MPDHAHSTDPAVQAQLDRLWALSPGRDVLGLERISALCDRLGNPQNRLPRTFHVAGTNGKGSTVAFLRAVLEASGRRVHAYTSPHLVRFNERIRIAGELISDGALAPLLAEVLDAADGLSASFFEVTTAAAFLAFARAPADDCIIEVGLGGRLDATNVIPPGAVCGIASLGIDHEGFLLAPDATAPDLPPQERIAWEKAGIAKPGCRVATLDYPGPVAHVIGETLAKAGAADWFGEGDVWGVVPVGDDDADGFFWRSKFGSINLPLRPALAGRHQWRNAGLAIAMLRIAGIPLPSEQQVATGIAAARWPARLQRLGPGPLTDARAGGTIWLDGGHNLDAAAGLARFLAARRAAGDPPFDVILGMLANKDAAGFIAAVAPHAARLVAVPIPGHEHHAPEALADLASTAGISHAEPATDITAAIAQLGASPAPLLIAGSLYLAGVALSLNEELPG